jgi:hypothetical protein
MCCPYISAGFCFCSTCRIYSILPKTASRARRGPISREKVPARALSYMYTCMYIRIYAYVCMLQYTAVCTCTCMCVYAYNRLPQGTYCHGIFTVVTQGTYVCARACDDLRLCTLEPQMIPENLSSIFLHCKVCMKNTSQEGTANAILSIRERER